MAKREFQLTESEFQALRRAYDQCKDGPTRSRYLAVRLYGSGYAQKEVLDISGCSRSSLMNWCRRYKAAGLAGLCDKRVGGTRARLSRVQIEELKARLHSYTPAQLFGHEAAGGQFWTVPDLVRGLEQWYGLVYQSLSSYTQLFDLCGFSYQRTEKVYKSRAEAKVAEFEAQLEKN
jgi:putative transposase